VEDPLSARKKRVIPYVEDRKNCLLLAPAAGLDEGEMASLQAALKNAIQIQFQLEESELAAEPLPSADNRRILLFYEAAEGGAGVLRRLLDDPGALKRVATQALELCHFDPETGADLKRAPKAREDCEAACYDCLMSYTNQMDHRLLDRHRIREILLKLSKAEVSTSPDKYPRAEQLERLKRQCESNLETIWLEFLEEHKLRLPSKAQTLIEACKTRPDFLYVDSHTAVYVDGPYHDYPEREKRDKERTEAMENLGYIVIRFGHKDDWEAIVRKYPSVFGTGS
jgi:very-short-patch-repair endonuclease